MNNNILPWHIVEKAIQKEQHWFAHAMDFGIYEKELPIGVSKEQLLRQISIAIVNGRIKAREYKTKKINSLWVNNSLSWELGTSEERHGGEWHRSMMNLVRKNFEETGCEVISEPYLNYGRADLGIYKKSCPNLYIEIGTTTLFKTWFNLSAMPNTIFLFVPSVYLALELQTK